MDRTTEIADKLIKQLEEVLIEDLKSHIERMIDKVVQRRFEGLEKKIDSIQRSVDLLQHDLDDDRKDLQQMRVDSSHIDSQVQEVRIALNKLPKRLEGSTASATTNAVAEAVPQAVSDTFDLVDKKVKVTTKKKSFWKFWKK